MLALRLTLRALCDPSHALTSWLIIARSRRALTVPILILVTSAALPAHKDSTVTLDHNRSRIALRRMGRVRLGLTSAALLHIH